MVTRPYALARRTLLLLDANVGAARVWVVKPCAGTDVSLCSTRADGCAVPRVLTPARYEAMSLANNKANAAGSSA